MRRLILLSILVFFSCSKVDDESSEDNLARSPNIMELINRQKYIVDSYIMRTRSGVGTITENENGRFRYDVDTSEGNQNNFYFSNDAALLLEFERILVYEAQNCETAILYGCQALEFTNFPFICDSSKGNILTSSIDIYDEYVDIRNDNWIWIISSLDKEANRLKIELYGRSARYDDRKPPIIEAERVFFTINENIFLNRNIRQNIDFVCNYPTLF